MEMLLITEELTKRESAPMHSENASLITSFLFLAKERL